MKKNGFTAREYVVTGMALFTAAFAEATAKQNNIDPSKMAAQANIIPANIAFVTQHHAELEAMQKKLLSKTRIRAANRLGYRGSSSSVAWEDGHRRYFLPDLEWHGMSAKCGHFDEHDFCTEQQHCDLRRAIWLRGRRRLLRA